MLAGRMKLRHFLMLLGGAGVLCAGGFLALPILGVSLLGERADAVPEDIGPASAEPTEFDRTLEKAIVDVSGVETESGPANATPSSAPATGREVDRAVLSWQGRDLGKDKLKDVTQGKPYKVNLYQDAGKSVMNRAKVDLDRDDKWDEKWTFDGPEISRKVAPDDDENYTASSVWDGTDWVAR